MNDTRDSSASVPAGDGVEARSDLVIIGSGMAAVRLVETLRRRGDRRSITLLGAERSLPYNRVLLSPLLAGETEWQQLISHDADWYAQQRIALRLGCAVTNVDVEARTVTCADGSRIAYGELVFATGAQPFTPAMPGIDLPGVTAFRHVDDVRLLQRATGRAVVLGGGLLGLEAAVGLAARGLSVTVVHRGPCLMNRQLDETAAAYLASAIAQRGVEVVTGCKPVAITGSERAAGVRLDDGRLLPADLVVLAVGIKPSTALARAAGIDVAHGIVVNGGLAASVPAVYALGECAEVNGETVGLVAPIWQQVEVLAARLCGEACDYRPAPYVTMLKVSGIDVHVCGDIAGRPGDRTLVYEDRAWGIYKKLVLREQRVVGALLYGDVTDSQRFFSLIQDGSAVDRDFCRLLLAGELPVSKAAASA